MSPSQSQQTSFQDWFENDFYSDEVFRRYFERLCRFIGLKLNTKVRRRVDPEDIVQSALASFFRVHEERPFRLNRSEELWKLLAKKSYWKMLNRVKHEKAKKRDIRREEGPSDDLAWRELTRSRMSAASDAELEITAKDLIEQCCRRLNEQQRALFVLELEDATYQQAAGDLDVTVSRIKAMMKCIREVLQGLLEDDRE